MGLRIKSSGLSGNKGWRNEPIRHGLARKGVKTGNKYIEHLYNPNIPDDIENRMIKNEIKVGKDTIEEGGKFDLGKTNIEKINVKKEFKNTSGLNLKKGTYEGDGSKVKIKDYNFYKVKTPNKKFFSKGDNDPDEGGGSWSVYGVNKKSNKLKVVDFDTAV